MAMASVSSLSDGNISDGPTHDNVIDLIFAGMTENDCFTMSSVLDDGSNLAEVKHEFSCTQCGFVFANDEALEVHVRSAHSSVRRRIHICPVCNKHFTQSCNLRTHLRIHTGERPFQCPHCDRTFTNKVNMLTHARTHTGERPFVCVTCQKQFTQESSLRVHTRTHTGERPYHCHLCTRMFAKSSDMQRHLRTHARDRPFGCDVCGRRFVQRSTLLAHGRSHNHRQECTDRVDFVGTAAPVSTSSTSASPYTCFICDRHYSRISCLKLHMKVHENDAEWLPGWNGQTTTEAGATETARSSDADSVDVVHVSGDEENDLGQSETEELSRRRDDMMKVMYYDSVDATENESELDRKGKNRGTIFTDVGICAYDDCDSDDVSGAQG